MLLLRAVQLGISVSDMELLTIGMITDMYHEAQLDREEPVLLATQEDMDRL